MKKISLMISIVAGAVLFTLFAVAPIGAAEPKAQTTADCQKFYDACYAQCRKQYPSQDLEGDAARTTCGTTCEAKRTACKAAIEYATKARPALEQMIEQLKSFLDDILKSIPEGHGPKTPPQETPEKKSDDGPVKI